MTENPYKPFRRVPGEDDYSAMRVTDERYGAWELGYNARCPDGWIVVRLDEHEALMRECEALRIERDAARDRTGEEPLVSLTRQGREWASSQQLPDAVIAERLAMERLVRINDLTDELEMLADTCEHHRNASDVLGAKCAAQGRLLTVYEGTLQEIAGSCGCFRLEPTDESEAPRAVDTCEEHGRPRAEWCGSCIATEALRLRGTA